MGQYYSLQERQPNVEHEPTATKASVIELNDPLPLPQTRGPKAVEEIDTLSSHFENPGSRTSARNSVDSRVKSLSKPSSTTSDANVLHVEFPVDLCGCKLIELSELAAEHALRTSGSKFELIGRLLILFPQEKLKTDSLARFKLPDLKSMAKGLSLPQVGSKEQLISSLLARVKGNIGTTSSGDPSAVANTPQHKRKRPNSDRDPHSDVKSKRARRNSNDIINGH